jgi:hypothetical protein
MKRPNGYTSLETLSLDRRRSKPCVKDQCHKNLNPLAAAKTKQHSSKRIDKSAIHDSLDWQSELITTIWRTLHAVCRVPLDSVLCQPLRNKR